MSASLRPRVLVVEDEPDSLEVFVGLLEQDHDVFPAGDAEEALEKLAEAPVDVVVSDIRLPGMSGVDLSREVLARYPETEVILMTGNPTVDSAVEALQLGVVDYLRKPFQARELEAAIACSMVRLRQRLAADPEEGEGPAPGEEVTGLARLRGESVPMRHLRRVLARVRLTDTTTLITGRTGVGKEVAARALHEASHRAGKPFLALNCATFSPELLESELFGYTAGAFTGARKDRVGLIESAHEGTLFLDEIGEMPLDLQAKLLRVLQEREVRRLGATRTTRVDVRFLAATNRDLAKEVEARRFRQDLYYRLNVYPVRIPSLRRRRDDVPLLARHFLVEVAEAMQVPTPILTEEVAELLKQRDWPGNVRELRNLCERLVLIADGGTIDRGCLDHAEHLDANPSTFSLVAEEGVAPDSGSSPPAPDPLGLDSEDDPEGDPDPLVPEGPPLTLAEMELRYIRKVLADCGGNKSKAARVLGIHPSTIQRKLGEG